MKSVKIAQLKAEMTQLTKLQKKNIKGGASFVYGDGKCRVWAGGAVCSNQSFPPGFAGYCTCTFC
jgi:hypothetical protein